MRHEGNPCRVSALLGDVFEDPHSAFLEIPRRNRFCRQARQNHLAVLASQMHVSTKYGAGLQRILGLGNQVFVVFFVQMQVACALADQVGRLVAVQLRTHRVHPLDLELLDEHGGHRVDLKHGAGFGQRTLEARLQLTALKAGAHPCPQQDRIKRFGKVISGAQLNRADHVGQVIVRRNHDHRDALQCRVSLHCLKHTEAVEHRHHDVEQDQVELIVAHRGQGFLAIAGHRQIGVAVTRQPPGQRIAVGLIVIDDEE